LAAKPPGPSAGGQAGLAGNGHALARQLMDNWGVPSVLFDEPDETGAAHDQAWRAEGDLASRVRRVLSIASAPPEVV
jgi:hypothetical protein